MVPRIREDELSVLQQFAPSEQGSEVAATSQKAMLQDHCALSLARGRQVNGVQGNLEANERQ